MSESKIDYNNLKYFHDKYGGLCVGYTGAEKDMELIKAKHPELYKAYQDLTAASKIFEIVLDNVVSENWEY